MTTHKEAQKSRQATPARTETQISSSRRTTYKCKRCVDAGFTEGEISYPPYGTSHKRFCVECDLGKRLYKAWASESEQQSSFRQWKQDSIRRALKLSGVDGLFREKRLSDLAKTPSLFKECKQYVDNWAQMKAAGHGFYLWGNVGSGKTHTASALSNELIEEMLVEVLFLNVPETATRVKNTFGEVKSTPDSVLFKRMKEAELLVLDDLGVEKNSDWLSDQIYQIVDYRWRNRKPMIITSNQSLNDLRRYYKPQIASRLYGCCKPMKFELKDRRMPTKSLF